MSSKKHVFVFVAHEIGEPNKLRNVGIAYSKNKPFFVSHEFDDKPDDFNKKVLTEIYEPVLSGVISMDFVITGSYDSCGFTGNEPNSGIIFKLQGRTTEDRLRFFYGGEYKGHTVSFVSCTIPVRSETNNDSYEHFVTKEYLRDKLIPTLEGEEKEFVEYLVDTMDKKFWF